MNPNSRTIVIDWANHAMAGDELLEIWLKRAGAWTLTRTIPVASMALQSDTFDLATGTTYAAQIRARRGGVYRTGYSSSDPEDWPTQSRLDYTTGQPTPVLAFVQWERTSSTVQVLEFTFANIDTTKATRVWRQPEIGGPFVQVATVLAGTSAYSYPIAGGEEATTMVFYIDQAADDATSVESNHVSALAGLLPPTDFVQIGGPDWYEYTVQWVAGPAFTASVSHRVQDDYCGAFALRVVAVPGVTTQNTTGLTKFSAMGPNGNRNVAVNVRIRAEVTTFTITDVSAWVDLDPPASVDIAPDETAYGAC